MMSIRLWFAVLLVAALSAICAAAQAATIVSNTMERVTFIDPRSVGGWRAEEATLAPAVINGEQVLLFRVKVDWKGGEANYPIGWPRIQLKPPADWRKWELMKFRVLAKSSTGSFPFEPLGITISTANRNANWERGATPLEQGKWQEFTFSLRDIPSSDRVDTLGVYIYEGNYRDGDVLEFYISNLDLVRYLRPTLMSFRPLANVAFTDAKALPIIVEMLGVAAGATAPVEIELRQRGQVVATATAQAAEGETQVSLPLSKPLSSGAYSLGVKAGGRSLSHDITLVASPWQGVN